MSTAESGVVRVVARYVSAGKGIWYNAGALG
jgi:hypothetical protein